MSTDHSPAPRDAPGSGPVPAPDLVDAVCAVPGVRGIEAGIASTLRTIDARLRRDTSTPARYGVVVDRSLREATVEVALEGPAPVRRIVEAVQRTVQDTLGRTHGADQGPWTVTVRVQSLSSARTAPRG